MLGEGGRRLRAGEGELPEDLSEFEFGLLMVLARSFGASSPKRDKMLYDYLRSAIEWAAAYRTWRKHWEAQPEPELPELSETEVIDAYLRGVGLHGTGFGGSG